MGQRRQGLGHGLAGDQCLDNAASAEAQDVGHHRVQLDVGILQRLLDALNVLERSRTICLRVRSKSRICWVGSSGTKLALISPCAISRPARPHR